MTRTPLEMLNACLANLSMVRDAFLLQSDRAMKEGNPSREIIAWQRAKDHDEVIALLRSEFATLLDAPLIITNGQ